MATVIIFFCGLLSIILFTIYMISSFFASLIDSSFQIIQDIFYILIYIIMAIVCLYLIYVVWSAALHGSLVEQFFDNFFYFIIIGIALYLVLGAGAIVGGVVVIATSLVVIASRFILMGVSFVSEYLYVFMRGIVIRQIERRDSR